MSKSIPMDPPQFFEDGVIGYARVLNACGNKAQVIGAGKVSLSEVVSALAHFEVFIPGLGQGAGASNGQLGKIVEGIDRVVKQYAGQLPQTTSRDVLVAEQYDPQSGHTLYEYKATSSGNSSFRWNDE